MFGKRRIGLCAAFLFTSIVFVSFLRAGALAHPFDLVHEAAKRNNLLPVWLEFRAHESEYLANPDLSRVYISAASWLNSYLGEYRSALGLAASQPTPKSVRDDTELRRALENYHPVDAVEAIAAATRNRRVVMINEEHRDSSHRAFTTELLPILRKQGFRYLAAEAFGSDITAAGYPKVGRDYTDDPVFGDMIRRAIELGFTLAPYEAPSQCSAAELQSIFKQTVGPGALLGSDKCLEGRELGQARNLAQFVENHPGEKLLVHAGMGHIQKTDLPFGYLMAWNFRELTKIDPLSIDQNYMSERDAEQPEYPLIAAKYADRTVPFVLRSGDGFFLPQNAEGVDIAVIHPRARYENGRPTWLSTGGWRKPSLIAQLPAYQAAVSKLQEAGTTLLQVFLISDKPDAVPVDQFLITDPLRPAALMLPDGKYRVRVIDRNGKTLVASNL
jgi:hypothetical protein